MASWQRAVLQRSPDESRFVNRVRDTLVFEDGDTLWLAPGIPRRWLGVARRRNRESGPDILWAAQLQPARRAEGRCCGSYRSTPSAQSGQNRAAGSACSPGQH